MTGFVGLLRGLSQTNLDLDPPPKKKWAASEFGLPKQKAG